MCGIAGMISVPCANRELALRLQHALRHRGPDDEGIAEPIPSVYLVHTRLSVLDLSLAGHQPMSDRSGNGRRPNWLVFNGEIYNYQALANDLTKMGFRFRTNTDTEVILHAYRAWGERCVDRFRGMFAFCLVNTELGIAYLYRDRLGIKPLYLFRPACGGLIFSSEIRTFLELGADLAPRTIDRAALEGFFAQGAIQGYTSLLRGVTMLRPGAYLSVDLSTGRVLKDVTYWSLPASESAQLDRPKVVEELRNVARETVRLHLISDAPLGLFLSGGVDSTALLTMACEQGVNPPRTLTIAFDSQHFDESSASSATAAEFRVNHQTVTITGNEILRSLDRALAAMDQPTVDGFNTYFVSRAARQAGLTVALSGLGGDELFGGYDSFRYVPWITTLRTRAVRAMCARLGAGMLRNRAGVKLREALQREPDLLKMYLLRRELFLPYQRRELHPLPETCDPVTGLDEGLLAEVRAESASRDEINRISLFEIELYMRHMLLRDADAFSMAAPIEYRVPFLDHVFVESTFILPGDWKIPDPRPKPLLIDIAGGRIPAAVWRRPKQGFAFPWVDWFASQGALSKVGRDAANDSTAWRQLSIDPAAVLNIWDRFASGDRCVSPLQILAFVTLRDFTVRNHLSV